MIAKSMLLLVLVSAAGATAADSRPPAGSYGFDWLDPEGARCREITGEDLAKFKTCEASANGFGLDLESRRCTVDEDSEFMVYATRAQCQQALETMQANGP